MSSGDVIAKYVQYLASKIHEEVVNRLKGDGSLKKVRVKKSQSGGWELSCQDALNIYGRVYFVVGDEYIKKVKPFETKLRIPPIYFKDGECEKELKKIGIFSNGVYIVKNGKLDKKVHRFG